MNFLCFTGARVDYPFVGRYTETSLSDPQVTPFIHMLHTANFAHIEAFLDAGIDPLYMHSQDNQPVSSPSLIATSTSEEATGEQSDNALATSLREDSSKQRDSVDPLNTWHYLIFHLQHIDPEVIKVLLHAGGIVPETEEAAMHSIFLRYMIYITHNTHVSARIVEDLLFSLLETKFLMHKEEFIELLYERFRSEMEEENTLLPNLIFNPCRPHTDATYQNQKQALSSVDELFVATMWNLKIYVKRLKLTTGFLQDFFQRFASPKSLKNMNRLVIRSCLGRHRLKMKIEELPLPNDLKKYVYEH